MTTALPQVTSSEAAATAPRAPARRDSWKLSSVLALTDQAVVSGTRFLTTIIIGRICGPDELGIYSLAFAPVLAIAVVQEALIARPYTVYGSRANGRARTELAGSVLSHYLALALVSSAGIAVCAVLFSRGVGPTRLAPVFWVLVGVIPFTLFWEFARRFAFAHLDLRSALTVDVAVACLQLGGLLSLAATQRLTVSTAYATIGIASAMVGLAWLFCSRRSFSFRYNRVAPDWKRHWSFGRWLAAGQLVGTIHGHAMLWLTAFLIGTAQTGIFAVCQTLVLFSNPIILGVSNLLGPQAARAYALGGRRLVRKITHRGALILTGCMTLYGVILAIAGNLFAVTLFGSDYAGHGTAIAIIGFCAIPWGLSTAISNGLAAIERSDVVLHATLIGFAVTMLPAVPLVWMWRIPGACLALLIGSISAACWQQAAFLRLTKEA